MYHVSEKDRVSYIEYFGPKTYTDNLGVIRWLSNERVPPEEIVRVWVEEGFLDKADEPRFDAARDEDTKAFFAEYRANQLNRSPEQIAEQRFEARAAHGPGVELVNAFTGERYVT
jgi:hypothetical protein|tara:strand:+ start:980 stop:1324 length:345 start_codon:yes stop_codon:yes gene_type:complete